MKQFNYYFGVIDYIIFGALLLLSALTGIYFACREKIKKQEPLSFKDYLTGNKNLNAFPVAMSLIASYISGVTMLGTPVEVYTFGAQYWLIVVALILSGLTVATVYLPVFTKLQIMFLPMLIYVPSLAFSQVSGINHHIIGAIVCAVVIFYTTLGGLRAVVYTDTWQTVIMFIADLVVVIVGIIAVGGIGVIIEKGIEGNRLQNLNFSPSMYERYTVWSILIGGYTYWTSFNAINQTMVQRYLSLPNDRKAKLSVALFTLGVVFFISMCCFAGLLLYTTYSDCDPLTAQRITKRDQLLPLFVVETTGHLKGVAGLFIAGVFGAGLSSLSVVLNSSAVVLLEDLMRGVCSFELTENAARVSSKIIVVTLGVLATSLVLVIEQMGGVFEVATSLSAISAGTMFGVFSLGMLIPWSNTKGAIAGALCGFIVSCFIAFGNQYVSSMKLVVPRELPVSVEGCARIYNVNVTTSIEKEYPDSSDIFPLFRLSFFWITPIGVLTVLTVGIITSFLTGKTDLKTLDPELISPISQWLLPAEAQNYAGSAVRKIEHKRLLGGFTRLNSSAATIRLNEMREIERPESR